MTDSAFKRLSSALGSTYDLRHELGGGGMSRVYVAIDRELDRPVVVKTLPPDIMSHDAVERFKREIRTAAKLQHPNIVPLLSAGDADGVPYYTMPLVEGASLRERIQHGRLPVGESIAILRDVARALAAAHAKGVVHRDIKPENVLLSSGAALVTDFGVARALSAATTGADGNATGFHTATGVSVGTPAYMAPEQFAADPSIDQRADIYAWGVVAYELLAGHHPFEGATGSALLTAHLTSKPKPLLALSPAVPARVSAIVSQALEKDPTNRPASADDLVKALEVDAAAGSQRARAPRRVMAFVVAAIVIAAVVGAFALRPRVIGSRDDRKIAVAPFRVGGASPDVHYLREGLGDLMTPQLQAIPGVSAPSMRVMLEQWRRAGGSTDVDLADDRARRAAAGAGAGQLILGEIVGTAKHITISAQLVRVSDGASIAPAKVEGPPDSAAALAARLVGTLLSLREGGDLQRVRSVISANPEAITPFLAGEQQYRRGKYADAARSFAASFERDTTFALAALRVGISNGWLINDAIPGPWIGRAWEKRARLSGADSLLLVAYAGTSYPAPTPERSFERDIWAIGERANSAEVWYVVGDQFLHRYLLSGDTTGPHRALDAFRKAEALDSSFVPALEHQSSLYATLGDTASERGAWYRQRMLDSTGDFFLFTDALFRSTSGSIDQAMQVRSEYRKPGGDVLRFVADILSGDATMSRPVDDRRLIVGDAFIKASEELGLPLVNDASLMLQNESYWINTGRPHSFRAAPGPDSALAINTMNTLAGTAWDGDSAVASRSAAELARWAVESKDTTYSLWRSSGYLTLGLWALAHGDTATVERARAGLRGLRAPAQTPWLTTTPTIHEKLLAAQLAVARKSPDARARLTELDSLLTDFPGNRNVVLNLGNLVVSQLWESVGDDQRALDAIERRHMWIGAAGFASARLRAKARLAERLGKRELAIAALRSFVSIRAKADAPYQAEVAQARAHLAKLEQHAGGR